jgi:hypothetical protein
MPCKNNIFALKVNQVTVTRFKDPNSKTKVQCLKKNNPRGKVIKSKNNSRGPIFSNQNIIIFKSIVQQNNRRIKRPRINTLIKLPMHRSDGWNKFPVIKNLLSINKSLSVNLTIDKVATYLVSQGLTHKLINKRIKRALTIKNLKRA